MWRNRRYPGLIELRASPVAGVLLTAAILGVAAGLSASPEAGIAVLFAAGVGLLCLTLGVMRWSMHRAAGRDDRVW